MNTKPAHIDCQLCDLGICQLCADERFADALPALDALLAREPANARGHATRGYALSALGRNDDAVPAFREAARLDPREISTWFNLGRALAHSGRRDEAIEAFDKALAIDPAVAPAWHQKGLVMGGFLAPDDAPEEPDAGLEAALQCFDHALEIDPRSADAWLHRGLAHMKLAYAGRAAARALAAAGRGKVVIARAEREQRSHLAEALRSYDRAAAAETGWAAPWFERGVTMDFDGDGPAARDAFRRATELAPDDPDAWYQLAGTCHDLGELDLGRESLRRAVALDPELGTDAEDCFPAFTQS